MLCLPALAAAAGEAAFEVSGTLEPSASGLTVRVGLRNVGAQTAEDVRVEGDLLGSRAVSQVTGTLPAGGAGEARLAFPEAVPAPGVHALVLRLEYESAASPDSAPTGLSQWAYLLLAFGGPTAPTVRIDVPAARFTETAAVPVALRSADGRPHRVRLTLYVPRVLGGVPHAQTVEVPASGEVAAPVRLFRTTASPNTTHGLLALAVTDDGGAVRTAAATAVAHVGPDPAVVPRARRLILGTAALLLALAGVRQWKADLARRRLRV